MEKKNRELNKVLNTSDILIASFAAMLGLRKSEFWEQCLRFF